MQEPTRAPDSGPSDPIDAALDRDLTRLSTRAGLVLWWEHLWPALVPILCVVALFVAASWFGVFAALPLGRAWWHWPFHRRAARRLHPAGAHQPAGRIRQTAPLDRDSGQRHGPASAGPIVSRPAPTTAAAALCGRRIGAAWRPHSPAPASACHGPECPRAIARVARRAPFAAGRRLLRGRTGPFREITEALDPSAAGVPPVEARIDGWIDPPTIRGCRRWSSISPRRGMPLDLRAPVGSTLVLRWPEDSGVARNRAQRSPRKASRRRPASRETRWRITGDAR